VMTRVDNYLFIGGEDRGFSPAGLRPKALSAPARPCNVLGGDDLGNRGRQSRAWLAALVSDVGVDEDDQRQLVSRADTPPPPHSRARCRCDRFQPPRLKIPNRIRPAAAGLECSAFVGVASASPGKVKATSPVASAGAQMCMSCKCRDHRARRPCPGRVPVGGRGLRSGCGRGGNSPARAAPRKAFVVGKLVWSIPSGTKI